MTNVSNPIPYEIPYENTTTSCFEEVVTASTLGIPSYKWMLGNSRFVYGKKGLKAAIEGWECCCNHGLQRQIRSAQLLLH